MRVFRAPAAGLARGTNIQRERGPRGKPRLPVSAADPMDEGERSPARMTEGYG